METKNQYKIILPLLGATLADKIKAQQFLIVFLYSFLHYLSQPFQK